jgi:hypothetical protein
MHKGPLTLAAAVGLGLACPSSAEADGKRQAWFLQDNETGQWCAFTAEASARAAEDGERFDFRESGWLEFGGDAPLAVKVTSQSEDAYVEDTYSFAPDMRVSQVVRKGHYWDDPFFTATYRLDDAGNLRRTAESVEAGKTWQHTTYFLDWSMYRSFAELPFAALIETQPRVSVSANC